MRFRAVAKMFEVGFEAGPDQTNITMEKIGDVNRITVHYVVLCTDFTHLICRYCYE